MWLIYFSRYHNIIHTVCILLVVASTRGYGGQSSVGAIKSDPQRDSSSSSSRPNPPSRPNRGTLTHVIADLTMAKTSKRSRKFTAKGGVKTMLDRGQNFTKKGKVRSRRGPSPEASAARRAESDAREAAERREQADRRRQKRDDEDLVGESNLGDLNIDEFFQSVADAADQDGDGDEEMGDNDMDSGDEGASDNTNNDDDDAFADDISDDSNSDNEDIEVTEQKMREEMKKLSESDPDFHTYLNQNEKGLLAFGEDEDVGSSDEGDALDDEENADMEEVTEKKAKPQQEDEDSPFIILTPKLLHRYEEGAFQSHGIKALKRIISAYKTACHLSDAADNDEEKDRSRKSYHIDDSAVFDRLMGICLRQCHQEFYYHLLSDDEIDGTSSESKPFDPNKPISPKLLAKSRRWALMKPILQSFLKSTLHILSEGKEPVLLTFILKSLSSYIPYMTAYPIVAKMYLKTLTALWSASLDTSEDYQVVRLNAFLRIRQMALTQPFPFIETCLKSTYLAYAKRAKFATAATVTSLLPTLTFMGNCVVELYSLDYASSYQHAFVYIRQLALHLRSAVQKKTPETFRIVYCWQYIHCLKLWTAILSSSCKAAKGGDNEAQLLRSLIFPLTEVIFGVIRLVPTTRHLPLRLHCVRFLQEIAASAELYIPTTSVLLDVLDLKELYLRPKRVDTRGQDVRGIRLPLILKLPKDGALRTAEQLDACLGEVFLLLNRETDLYRYSPGFPEFTVRICQRLRKFSKETKNGRYRAYSRGCIELCEKQSAEATKGRSQLKQAPKDVKRLEVLKPGNVPCMGERYEAFIAKEKRLEAASQPALSEGAKKKAQAEAARQQKEAEDKAKKESKTKKKKVKKEKKKLEVNQTDLDNVDALEEEDEVQEGIDWDSEDEGEE